MKLSKLLQELIAAEDIQITELSRRTGVNRPYIYRKLEGKDTNLETLFDILTGDVEPDEFIIALRLIRRIKTKKPCSNIAERKASAMAEPGQGQEISQA